MSGVEGTRDYDTLMPSHLKRYQTGGDIHFITFSCYRRLPYLNDDAARLVFQEQLERLPQRHQFYVFGYVLMPEHVHLLLSEPRRHPLSTTLNVLKAETSKLLKAGRRQFWQTRYYDFNVLTAPISTPDPTQPLQSAQDSKIFPCPLMVQLRHPTGLPQVQA